MIVDFFKKEKESKEQTAREFVAVKDIKDGFLVTTSGDYFCYLKIAGIPIDLMTISEQKMLTKELTANLSGTELDFHLLTLAKSIDLSPLIAKHIDYLETCNDRYRRSILRAEINHLSGLAMNKDNVEKQFYLYLTGKDKHALNEKMLSIKQGFEECKVKVTRCENQEILQIINLVNYPHYAGIETDDYEDVIPFLR